MANVSLIKRTPIVLYVRITEIVLKIGPVDIGPITRRINVAPLRALQARSVGMTITAQHNQTTVCLVMVS